MKLTIINPKANILRLAILAIVIAVITMSGCKTTQSTTDIENTTLMSSQPISNIYDREAFTIYNVFTKKSKSLRKDKYCSVSFRFVKKQILDNVDTVYPVGTLCFENEKGQTMCTPNVLVKTGLNKYDMWDDQYNELEN